jgi:hypothetical protein
LKCVLGEVTLVLGLEVVDPFDGIFEGLAALFQDLHASV